MARLWPWRRKSEGFEWHKYVRTTIAIRREQRRERVEEIRRAAEDGALRAAEGAARLGRKGAQAAGEGARRASAASRRGLRQGLMASARGLKSMGAASAVGARRLLAASAQGIQRASAASAHGLRGASTYGGAGLRAAGRWLGRASVESAAWTGSKLAALSHFAGGGIGRASRPLFDFLGRPGVAGPLMLAGAVALISGLARPLLTRGLDREALLVMSIGAICLIAGLTPRLRYGMAGTIMARAVAPLHRLPPRLGHIVAGGGAIAAAVLAAVWLWPAGVWPSSSTISLPSMSLSSFVPFKASEPPIVGRAWAVGGDTIRMGQGTIRLDGIEAPDRDQTCVRPDNRRWRCGEAAQMALSRLVAGRQVHCEVAGKGEAGIVRASCSVAGTDLAGALVEGGHVLAESGTFARYRSAQAKAQQAKVGIWNGPGAPERASEWRTRLWNEARAQAPQGCPIKGKVAGRRGDIVKTYHLPWSPAYVRLRVVSARGERWFCSEAEAQAAGFTPAEIDG